MPSNEFNFSQKQTNPLMGYSRIYSRTYVSRRCEWSPTDTPAISHHAVRTSGRRFPVVHDRRHSADSRHGRRRSTLDVPGRRARWDDRSRSSALLIRRRNEVRTACVTRHVASGVLTDSRAKWESAGERESLEGSRNWKQTRKRTIVRTSYAFAGDQLQKAFWFSGCLCMCPSECQ